MKTNIVYLFLTLFWINGYSQYQHDSLKVDEGYIHYYTKGEGEAIVLLQGGPSFSSYYMRAIADSLLNYKTILIDYQGTGRSQYKKVDSTWVNPDNIIMDVELVRKHLAIDKWIVLGQSWATHFALLYGIKYPQHTSKIILQATAGTDNKFQEYYGDNIERGLTEDDITKMEALWKDSTSTWEERFGILLNGYFYDRTKSSSFLNYPPAEAPFFYNSDFFMAFVKNPGYENFDISRKAYELDIPVRIIQGRQDPVNGGTQERLNERLKHSKIFYIERAGHFPWLEQPQDFFAKLKESLND